MADESLSACLAEIKENSAKFYVYVLSRPCGTPFYVGAGRNRRISDHEREAKTKRRSRKLNIIRKITRTGESVRYRVDGWFGDWNAAAAREIELIAAIGRSDLGLGPLANATSGGDGIHDIGPEARKKLSDAMRLRRSGQALSPEHVAAISEGLRKSEKAKAANARKRGKKQEPEVVARRAEKLRGKKISEAQKAFLRKIHTGKKLTPEHVEKIREARKGFKHSEETKAQMSAIRKTHHTELSQRAKAIWADEEIRARILSKQNGRKASDETREKLSAVSKARWADPAFRETMMIARAAAKENRNVNR